MPIWGDGVDREGWRQRPFSVHCERAGAKRRPHANVSWKQAQPMARAQIAYLFLQFLQVSPLGLQLILQFSDFLKHITSCIRGATCRCSTLRFLVYRLQHSGGGTCRHQVASSTNFHSCRCSGPDRHHPNGDGEPLRHPRAPRAPKGVLF